MKNKNCTQCGKVILAPSRERKDELVLKVRVTKFRVPGGVAEAKCRHCGTFVSVDQIRLTNY